MKLHTSLSSQLQLCFDQLLHVITGEFKEVKELSRVRSTEGTQEVHCLSTLQQEVTNRIKQEIISSQNQSREEPDMQDSEFIDPFKMQDKRQEEVTTHAQMGLYFQGAPFLFPGSSRK